MFEEGGPGDRPFHGSFGLRAEFGINKPSFYDFALPHKLGGRRIANDVKDVIVTKSDDGSVVVAAWNIVDPAPDGQPSTMLHAKSKTMTLEFRGVAADARVSVERVDNEHGMFCQSMRRWGDANPTPAQVEEMNRKTALPAAETRVLKDGKVELKLEPNALVVVRVDGKS